MSARKTFFFAGMARSYTPGYDQGAGLPAMNTLAEIVIFVQSPELLMVGTIRPYPPYEAAGLHNTPGRWIDLGVGWVGGCFPAHRGKRLCFLIKQILKRVLAVKDGIDTPRI